MSQLKSWIREEIGKPNLADDAILVRRLPEGGIRIQLLDGTCCRPALDILRPLHEISRKDIHEGRHKLMHHH